MHSEADGRGLPRARILRLTCSDLDADSIGGTPSVRLNFMVCFDLSDDPNLLDRPDRYPDTIVLPAEEEPGSDQVEVT